jgi:hypothetical protein
MPDERAIDLSSLGDVVPPDAVGSALRRFRRRVFTTGALVALSALSLAGGILWATVFHRTFPERIEAAPGVYVGAVFSGGDAVTVLERVARLDEGVGLHLHVATPEAPPRSEYWIRMPGIREFDVSSSGKVHDFYLVIAPHSEPFEAMLQLESDCGPGPSQGRCARPQPVHRIAIDLEALGVPEDLWKE